MQLSNKNHWMWCVRISGVGAKVRRNDNAPNKAAFIAMISPVDNSNLRSEICKTKLELSGKPRKDVDFSLTELVLISLKMAPGCLGFW